MADIDELIRTNYKAVDKHDTLSSVIGWVRGDTHKVPIITDDGRPFGVLNERAIMSKAISHTAKLEAFTLTTRALPKTARVEDVIARMAEYRTAHVPIAEDNGKIAGYVSALDLARETEWQATAGDICVPVSVLTESSTIGDALHIFNQEYVDHLPVLDGRGRLAGVMRRVDLIQLTFDRNDIQGRKDAGGDTINPLREPVKGLLEGASTVGPTAKKEEILRKVEDFGHVVVQNGDGRILGVITPQTLARNVPV